MRETLKRFAGTVVGHVIANVYLSMRTKDGALRELQEDCDKDETQAETRNMPAGPGQDDSPRDNGRLSAFGSRLFGLVFVDGGG